MVDLDKIPPFAEPKKVNAAIKDYAKMLQADWMVTNFYQKIGTMGMADLQNTLGGLPVRNFSAGQQADVSTGEKFKMGGEYISQLNISRGGEQTHACMPGCVIQCSNVYADAAGKEVVSPVEYETLGLLGTNCGLTDPDDLAQMNYVANDLGVDTIETGRHAGRADGGRASARFGDVKFMAECLRRDPAGHREGPHLGAGHGAGRRALQGQAGAGHQEAGDQRLRSARGRGHRHHHDGHRPGRRPHRGQPAAAQDARDGASPAIIEQSLAHQTRVAANDSLGLCIFGMSVTEPNIEFLADAINAAHGTSLTKDFFEALGRETLRLEHEFNRRAGFTAKDDELPAFFYTEALPPTNHVARFHGADVHGMYERLV